LSLVLKKKYHDKFVLHTPSSRVPPVKAQAHAKPVKTASTVNIAKKMVALAGFVSKPASQLRTTL
jgi:hypothetical protein